MIERTESTPLAQGSRDWLDWRKGGIGGSEVAAVLGLDPYRTPLDVQRDKLGYAQPIIESGPMKAGKLLEPHVAQMYAEATGRSVFNIPPRTHNDHDWMRGSADRMWIDGERASGILEIKTTGGMNFRKVKMSGIPASWLLQLQWYLAIYDLELGSYAILDRDSFDLIHFDFHRDRELMAPIIEQAWGWWIDHVVNREPIKTTAPAPVSLPQVGGEVVQVQSDDWAAAVDALKTASEIAEQAVSLKAEAEARVKALMLAAKASVAEGCGVRVYYKYSQGRKSTDYKALLADHPEIDLSKYERRGEPFRSLRVYSLGEVS